MKRGTRGIKPGFVYLFKVGSHEFAYPNLSRAKAEGLKAMRRWYRNHGDSAVASPLVVYRRRGASDTRTVQIYHLGHGVMRTERAR